MGRGLCGNSRLYFFSLLSILSSFYYYNPHNQYNLSYLKPDLVNSWNFRGCKRGDLVEIGSHGLRSINCYNHYNWKWATGRLSWWESFHEHWLTFQLNQWGKDFASMTSVTTYLSGICVEKLEPFYPAIHSILSLRLVNHTLAGCTKMHGLPTNPNRHSLKLTFYTFSVACLTSQPPSPTCLTFPTYAQGLENPLWFQKNDHCLLTLCISSKPTSDCAMVLFCISCSLPFIATEAFQLLRSLTS